uniref:DUF4283 domain-containing protein n=1 Tax=Glycine max TaxID=3847 RepID=A0A0R0F7B8_SOYBN
MEATQGFSFSSDYLNGLGSGKDPSDDGGGGGPPNQKSFRDLVVSQRQLLSPHPNVDLIQQKLARIKYEGGNPMKPMVFIDDSIYEGLCAPWEDTLLIKLLGKTVGYHFLKEKLVRLWKLSSYFDIFDIGNGYYMLKFSDEDDKKKVMEERDMDDLQSLLNDAKIDKTLVWIRFLWLNSLYYDEIILLALTIVVGRPTKVDSNVKDDRRGRLARVCIEVDLTKQVVGKVWLRDMYKNSSKGVESSSTAINVESAFTITNKKDTIIEEFDFSVVSIVP